MMEDPRRTLEEAAERRAACEILPRRGGWARGRFVRVEPGGVVVVVPELKLSGGEDVRCWFALDGVPLSFEASVIRAGVPVPDRSQHGLLLGFIASWSRGEPRSAGTHGLDLAILPPNGPGISLLHGPGRLMDLGPEHVTFTLPAGNTLVFVAGSRSRLRFTVPGEPSLEVDGRVDNLVPGESHLLYTVKVEGVEEPETYRRVVAAVRRALETESED